MYKKTSKMKNINLDNTCRSCLTDRGYLREINDTKIPKMIEFCASIKITSRDGLPNKICVSCFHLVAKLYSFKKKLERSDRILRNYCKEQKKHQKRNILKLALSSARIEEEPVIEKPEEYLSEEDTPLSLRLIKPSLIDETTCSSTTSNIIDTDLIFTDGPPPLVPLTSVKTEEQVVKPDLPSDTPPLIPITPTDPAVELVLQCPSCGEDFNSIAALKEHKLNACQVKGLECNICHKEFKERKRLIGHLKGHMVPKDYICKICSKRYPNPSTFKVHMRTHTGERPFKCQVCSKGFSRWAGVVEHMRTHQEVKPFKCDTCDKSFKVASNLERHKVLHSGSLPYCCSYCGKTFSQSDNLQLHIRTYHTNDRPFLCNICGKDFVSTNRLTRHMWVHSGHKPYRCSVCAKPYSNSTDLKNHERSHNGKKNNDEAKLYGCESCKMRFYHPCRLARHMKTHEKPFACTICVKRFSSEGLLKNHVSNYHNSVFLEDVLANEVFMEQYSI